MVTPYEIAHAKALAEAPKMTAPTNAQSYTQSLKTPETGMQKMQREISASANGGRNWAPTTAVVNKPSVKQAYDAKRNAPKPVVYGSLEYTQAAKKPFTPSKTPTPIAKPAAPAAAVRVQREVPPGTRGLGMPTGPKFGNIHIPSDQDIEDAAATAINAAQAAAIRANGRAAQQEYLDSIGFVEPGALAGGVVGDGPANSPAMDAVQNLLNDPSPFLPEGYQWPAELQSMNRQKYPRSE
jgi:hypothetical protein